MKLSHKHGWYNYVDVDGNRVSVDIRYTSTLKSIMELICLNIYTTGCWAVCYEL